MSLLEDMHLFVEVSKTRNFTRAAVILGITVSTLSRRIKRLEETVGVRLLSRSTRVVELTEMGAQYYEACERIVAEAQTAHESLAILAGTPNGLLRAALPVDFSTACLDVPIARFVSRYPQIHLHLDLTSKPVDMISESFDVVVRVGHPPDSGQIAHYLADLPRFFYASPDVASALSHVSAPDELDTKRCIGLAVDTVEEWHASSAGAHARVTPQGPVSSTNVGLLRRLVLRGVGITVLPEVMVRNETENGSLVRLLPTWQVDPVPVYAFTQSRLVPAKVRLLINTIKDALRDGP